MGPLPAAQGCDCHICRPDDSYDDMDRWTIDTVVEHGWQVVTVTDDTECCHADHHDHAADEDDDAGPPFAYTVGLGHRTGHPELLMSGLDHGLMGAVLNNIARRVLEGRRLVPGDVIEDALAGVPVAVEQVSDEALQETVLWSGWFHRREPEAMAIVWPTRTGVFPWQPGAPDTLDELQPRRWRVPVEHTGALAADPAWVFPVPPDREVFSCTHVVDDGEAILLAARQSDQEHGEDWTIHCSQAHTTDDVRLVHLSHLVRSAPSLRLIACLGLDQEALRDDVDSPWRTGPVRL